MYRDFRWDLSFKICNSNDIDFIKGLFLMMLSSILIAREDLVDYVNSLQGTDSSIEFYNGNTYPVIALPFGMMAWIPQMVKRGSGWDYIKVKSA